MILFRAQSRISNVALFAKYEAKYIGRAVIKLIMKRFIIGIFVLSAAENLVLYEVALMSARARSNPLVLTR